MIEVLGLAASYAGIEALKGIDITVKEGEIVALVGANGAGKSTLLNCLSGVVKPKSGSIQFMGDAILGAKSYQVARRGLLQVPEGRQILGDLTVEENLQLGTLALGSRKSQYSLSNVITLFPILEEKLHNAASSLSGGQQQMLAIGRALMGGPKLLLLDEPSLGLSPLMTDAVFGALSKLNAEGLTILLVEQNAQRAFSSTTRAYILERGKIALEGESVRLLADDKVVEHYLGSLSMH